MAGTNKSSLWMVIGALLLLVFAVAILFANRATEARIDAKLAELKRIEQDFTQPVVQEAASAIIKDYDVMADVAEMQEKFPDHADISKTYHLSPSATVHMHIMGAGQFCPLHLHPSSYEAAIIVTGDGVVQAHHAGKNGAFEHREFDVETGDLIVNSPPGSHKFSNASDRDLLATLIVGAPPFTGNLYLEEPAERSVEASPTRLYHLGEPSDSNAPQPIDFHENVAIARREVAEKAAFTLDHESFVYVVAGQGELVLNDEPARALRHGKLIRIRKGTPIELLSRGERPLSVLTLELMK